MLWKPWYAQKEKRSEKVVNVDSKYQKRPFEVELIRRKAR
jgi:hypothetical protein